MIVSLTGRADNLELVFVQNQVGQWEAIVPPDMTDGMYVVELWAADDAGNIAYYTSFLYLFDGRMTMLQLNDDFFKVIISNDVYSLSIKETSLDFETKFDRYDVSWTERMVVMV